MGKATSMTSSPLERRRARRAGLGVVGAIQESSSSPLVALDDIAPNPDNPLERTQDSSELTDLAESIREVGVLSPVTLLPAEAFLAVKPHYAEQVGQRPWVLHAGARRWAAARLAGQTHIPGHVRRDLVDTSLSMIHENTHRLAFTPLQDAYAYERVMGEKGWSQRQLAQRTRIPQSQISKRLSLLALPAAVQQLVVDERVHLAHAYELAQDEESIRDRVGLMVTDLDPHDDVDLVALGRQARRDLAHEGRVAAARAVAGTEELLVERPEEVWGSGASGRELTAEAEIAAARQDGTLRVAPATPWQEPEQVRYYRDGENAEPAAVEPAAKENERAEDRSRREAKAARSALLASIVARPPAAAVMQDAVLDMVLHGGGLSADVARVAVPLGRAAGVTQTEDPKDYWAWVAELPGLGKKAALTAGWVLAVATRELAARSPHAAWGDRQVAYLHWLVEHGYEPTDWEAGKLERARADSAESPTIEEDRR